MTIRTRTTGAVRTSGFTLADLLVLLFVIGLIITMGFSCIPQNANRSRINSTRVTVNVIDKAIEMYHGEHHRYPSVKGMPAELYGQAFTSEQQGGAIKEVEDYQPGPGYRLEPRGRIYEPWNGVDRLKRSGDHVNGSRVFFQDAFNRSIWYCPFNAEPTAPEKAYHDAEFDSAATESGVSLIDIADYAKDTEGKYYRRDFILMSQSADGSWGKVRGPDAGDDQDAEPTDDITNFQY
jgi:general secretion pathway protein G